MSSNVPKIHELRYSGTNTYVIEGEKGILLFDTGWAGTFSGFCRAMGELRIPVQKVSFILVSHFHPDHMGIAQEIANEGAVILLPEVQKNFVHSADGIFEKDGTPFVPIVENEARSFPLAESREVLSEIGIAGQIFATPGHSDDSISLVLDSGEIFVGDLNPLYELELHKGTQIEKSWKALLSENPKTVYYGHARKCELQAGAETGPDAAGGTKECADTHKGAAGEKAPEPSRTTAGKSLHNQEQNADLHALVGKIMKLADKGCDMDKIQKKTGAGRGFIEDVLRMYLTHRNVGVQGILDRIEIKNR
ncbi:MAG: MBL fold metallo-hydrolase [Lachnospiraceae bacterium]|nr:MBL fold metallo-hydrolase [Lachnospiraceae bacterium]